MSDMSVSYMDRRHAAEFLSSLGFQISTATLAKYASVGGGPLMRHFGRRVVYDRKSLLEWANSKLSSPRRSTSDKEADVQ